MKKKIMLSMIGILLISGILIIITNKNKEKKFMQDGVMFAVTLDGISRNSFPSGDNYFVGFDCTNARGRWMRIPSTNLGSDESYRVIVDNITANATCDISFTTITPSDSSSPYLFKNFIPGLLSNKGTISSNNGILVNGHYGDYTNSIAINENGYTNWISPFYNDSFDATAVDGTQESTAISTFDSTNNYYQTNPTINNKYYNYIFQVNEAGCYQFCYKKVSGGTSNRLYLYKGSTNMYSSNYLTANKTTDTCFDYEYLTPGDNIKIIQHTYSGVAKLNIFMKKTTNCESYGYRYEGWKPNNFIWFNNEMWRIIGLVPTKVCKKRENNSCIESEDKYLLKIVRNDLINSLDWNTLGTNDWNEDASLYKLFNEYYINENINHRDGTNAVLNDEITKICVGTNQKECDYTVNGIGANAYYRNMVENVYWNIGKGTSTSETPSQIYFDENQIQTTEGKVGLMNISDLVYASTRHSDTLSSSIYYKSKRDNWINVFGFEAFLTANSNDNTKIYGTNNKGNIQLHSMTGTASMYKNVRPVVYLKDSVYVVSGDGTEANPYQVGMTQPS